MDFLKLVNEGVEKSNKALAAVAEVDEIYKRINAELKKYPAGELVVQRKISTLAQISSFAEGIAGVASGTTVESEYFKHDRIAVVLKVDGKLYSEDVAGWKQRVTGYPCILKFDGQELTCGSNTHLLNGMSELLSSVGFGNAVNRLRKAAAENAEAQQKKTPVEPISPGKTSSPDAKLLLIDRSERRGQNLTVKPAAVRAVAKSPTAPRVAKKPAASKVAAKPITPKKPVASKVAQKPAVPNVSKRPAAPRIPKKPAVTKAPGKPETSGDSAGPAASVN